MLTKFVRPILFNGVSSSSSSLTLTACRSLSISNKFHQNSTNKSLADQNKNEKVLRVKDSLKDLSSVKWRTEFNGKRLWPHVINGLNVI